MAGDAEKFDGGIEEREGENGVVPSYHIVAIAICEFDAGFALAIEYLHHAHAGNVFLQKSIDARDGGADAAVGVAHESAEEICDHEDEREHGKRVECKATVHCRKGRQPSRRGGRNH